MSTNFAGLNFYSRFSTPPRLCGFSAFPVAPRQSRRFSMPRIEVLVEPSDDSEDEGTLLSYHSMRLQRARATSPEVDDLEKRKLVSHEATVPKKKPTDTTNKWDYYVAPLSPLSDLTESDTSDSEDDVQSKPTNTPDDEPATPRSKPLEVGPVIPCITNAPLPSSGGLKRKRSSDSEITLTTTDTAPAVKDSEGPSKRQRRTSGTSEPSEAEKTKPSMTTRPVLSMSPEEIKKSIRRYGKTFGTVRKPKVMRGARFRQKEMGARS